MSVNCFTDSKRISMPEGTRGQKREGEEGVNGMKEGEEGVNGSGCGG